MRYDLHWGQLHAFEPTPAQVRKAAPALAGFYNDPANRERLGQSGEMTPSEVADWYAQAEAAGGRLLLLECAERLVGDADFRRIEGTSAEFALLIGDPSQQRRGLGARFAWMLHRWAFERLGFKTLFLSIAPSNEGSLRLFAHLGYRLDATPRGRRYAETPSDLTFSLAGADLPRLPPGPDDALEGLVIEPCP